MGSDYQEQARREAEHIAERCHPSRSLTHNAELVFATTAALVAAHAAGLEAAAVANCNACRNPSLFEVAALHEGSQRWWHQRKGVDDVDDWEPCASGAIRAAKVDTEL